MCRLLKGTCRPWRRLLGLGLAVGVVAVSGSGEGRAFGNVTTRMTVTPMTVVAESGFQASYFTGLVAELPSSTLSSIPGLAENVLVSTGSGFQVVLPSPAGAAFVQLFAYRKQDIVLDWPVGVWGVVSELAFSWDTRRHYLWSHLWVHYAGIALKVKAALARSDEKVGIGVAVGFEGTTLWGLALSIASQFGLTTERTALVRAVSQGQVSGEMFQYRGTSLTAGVFPLCCLSLDATVRLTKTGFDSARISTAYTLVLAEVTITAGATVVFKTEEKVLTVVPRLTLPGTGSEIYLSYSLIPSMLSSTSLAITGIRLDEAGLSGIQLGGITASGRYSFSGNVYRGSLQGLPRYDLVLSLRHGTLESELAFGLYFSAEGVHLFGLGLVTFEGQVSLFGDFRVVLGLDATTDTGWQRLTVELKYTFNLYGL